MFCFAGRRANMELQLPFVRRILAENPDVEYHIWNLARDHDDAQWLKTIEGDRITVNSDLYGVDPWKRFDQVYQHYTDDRYRDHLFIKLDDDVVFIESARIGAFIEAIKSYPAAVVTAKVVNNGACTATEPGLWQGFQKCHVQLLDVHKSQRYCRMSHNYFFDHWSDMVGQTCEIKPITDWLSINFIGYDWAMACRFAELIGSPSPRHIAGRSFINRNARLGDEGMVNTLPRVMLQGMLACHLYFGPQAKVIPAAHIDLMRQRYAEISEKYLTQT